MTVRRHRLMLVAVGILAIAVLAGGLLLWPRGNVARPAVAGQQDPTRLVKATLARIQTVPCQEPDPAAPLSTCIRVQARLAEDGRQVAFETTDPTGDTFRAGQRVRLSILEQPGQPTFYNIRDLERGRPMLALAALFMLAVVAFGRWQGLRSLLGLTASLAVILGFVVPAILRGRSPTAVALVGAMAIMLASLYLSHGTGRKTTAAAVGTALALLLTAALSAGFIAAAGLTGLASEEALGASFQVGGISLGGLLLAGIILGGLGVLDDVTVSQASLVFELRRADPGAGFTELVRSALSVGRDHVAATVNTLFLAYAGASLPLLVLFSTGGEALATVATAEVVAVEVVRTLCGSVGLIAAVPLTTLLAAALAPQQAAEPDTGRSAAATTPDPAAAATAPRNPSCLLAAAGHRPRQRQGAVRAGPGSAWTAAVACHRWGRPRGLAGPRRPAPRRQAGRDRARAACRGRSPERPLVSPGPARRHKPSRPARPRPVDLLRRYGPFSADTKLWVEDDPDPAVETAEALDGQPRVTYRLTAEELDHLDALLAEAGLDRSCLVPKRSRARPARR